MWTPDTLRAFEEEVKATYLTGVIRGAIHLSGGNEDKLIQVFTLVKPQDWVFSTYRSHYHALLKGVPPERVKAEILRGRSMHLNFPDFHFYTSAIVGGICPIALGVALGLKRRGGDARVWAFLGDMASQMGIFHECEKYARLQGLPLTWVVQDDGLSTNTPTWETWGYRDNQRPLFGPNVIYIPFQRAHPHIGAGVWVDFDKTGKPSERTDVMG